MAALRPHGAWTLTAMLLCTLLAPGCSDPDEPRAGGQPLSHWEAEARQVSVFPWLDSRSDERRREAFRQLEAMGEPAVPTLVELLDDWRAGTRGGALDTLGALGPRAAAATPALIRRLEDDDIGKQTGAALLLARIGPAAAAAVPVLEERLRNGDPRLRHHAARALAAIGGPGQQSLERLGAAPAPGDRRAALAGRAARARQDGTLDALLASALEDPDPGVRIEALAEIRPRPRTNEDAYLVAATLPLVLAASNDPESGLRAAAAAWLRAALHNLGPRELAEVLCEAGTVASRRQAAWSLGLARRRDGRTLGPHALNALEDALRDPDPMVRVYAARALSHLPDAADRLAPVVSAAIRQLPLRDRLSAAPTLYEISGDPRAVEPVYRELLQSPELAHHARRMREMLQVEGLSRALRPELEALVDHPNREVSRNARRALAALDAEQTSTGPGA